MAVEMSVNRAGNAERKVTMEGLVGKKAWAAGWQTEAVPGSQLLENPWNVMSDTSNHTFWVPFPDVVLDQASPGIRMGAGVE